MSVRLIRPELQRLALNDRRYRYHIKAFDQMTELLAGARLFFEYHVTPEEADINGFNLNAWCTEADRALEGHSDAPVKVQEGEK